MASLTCRDERYLDRARGAHLYRSYHMLPSGCTLARPRWGLGGARGLVATSHVLCGTSGNERSLLECASGLVCLYLPAQRVLYFARSLITIAASECTELLRTV